MERNKPGSVHICVGCGTEFVNKNRNTTAKYCNKRCQLDHMSGENNPRWRGGRIERSDGRATIYAPGHPNAVLRGGTYLYEYRLIASQMLGRPLTRNEMVHHKNGNHKDNRPENLEVMTRSQHQKLHAAIRRRSQGGAFLSEEKAASAHQDQD